MMFGVWLELGKIPIVQKKSNQGEGYKTVRTGEAYLKVMNSQDWVCSPLTRFLEALLYVSMLQLQQFGKVN